jgi:predicted dehydrogenase
MKRRDFLTTVAATGVAAGAVAKTRKPVVVADRRAPKVGGLLEEGETLGLGMIGVGGMGTGHHKEFLGAEASGMKVQVRAVSDVYNYKKARGQRLAKEIVGRNIEAYTDYADLLSRDDIHAVVIATPDHWHAQAALDALDAGKDVYLQKPMTYTTEEAVAVRDKVLETGRVFQCGAQQSSDDWWWQARKFIKQGGIGKVVWAQADHSRNSGSPENPQGGEWNWPIDNEQSTNDPSAKGTEAYVDWKRWLGTAPKREFSKPRFCIWRKYWDYSGGVATDLIYHVMAPMTIALDAQAPERAVGSGGIYVQRDDREVPDTFMMTVDYPEDYTVVMTSCMANRQGLPPMIRGHRATIRPKDGGIMVSAESEFKEWFKKEFGAEELFVPGEKRSGHVMNWMECIRSREQCHCDAETAYRAMAACRMAVDSYRKDEVIFWDSERECYVKKHPRPNRVAKG